MRSPNTGNLMQLVEGEVSTFTLRGLSFEVSSPAWECPDTRKRYSDPDQSNVFQARIHHAWRQHHGIGRTALRERRLALGLSAAQASALLGFGTNQYRTYEQTDKLPSKSNAVLLQAFMTDQGIAALLEGEATRQALKPAARRRLQGYVAALASVDSPTRRFAITASGFGPVRGSMGQFSEKIQHQIQQQRRQPMEQQLRQFFPEGEYQELTDAKHFTLPNAA